MAKRYMSDSEYEQQQFRWKHNLIDPYILQSVVDEKYHGSETTEKQDEEEKQRKQELKDKLWAIITKKIKEKLTPRQQDAVKLFLLNKKQEHMGQILQTSQEAANVRLRLGFERLRNSCEKDDEVQEILMELKK